MSQPFSGIPDPGSRPPIRRRMQPGVVQQTVQAVLRSTRRKCQDLWLQGKPVAQNLWLRGNWYSRDLWRRGERCAQNVWSRGKRNPRTVGLIGAALAVTVVG